MSGLLLLLEHHTDAGIEWVVSFEGPNPPPEKAVHCASRADAERLLKLMDVIFAGKVRPLELSSISDVERAGTSQKKQAFSLAGHLAPADTLESSAPQIAAGWPHLEQGPPGRLLLPSERQDSIAHG